MPCDGWIIFGNGDVCSRGHRGQCSVLAADKETISGTAGDGSFDGNPAGFILLFDGLIKDFVGEIRIKGIRGDAVPFFLYPLQFHKLDAD